MNREIKFRAWNGTEMSEPFNITSITKDDKYSGVVHEYRGMMDESFFYLYECRIMQFTGLTDKNGKDIYEGDILDFKFSKYSGFELEQTKRGFIEFNGLAFIFKTSYDDFYELVNLNFDSQSDCEIIGNIYENPELLQ